MVFANPDELLNMGGHGAYVWAAYGVTLVCLLALVLLPLLEKRRLLRDIAQRAARESKRKPGVAAAGSAVSVQSSSGEN